MEAHMLKIICITAMFCFASSAFAGPTCTAQASDKKLAGAAKTSFLKKCESDATAQCEAAAAEKKLAGAAKSSFTKKCVSDAVGAAS
jgi:hypothetical protein